MKTGKLCPVEWHVPTDIEWSTLTDYLGGDVFAGGKLKDTETGFWASPNFGASNEVGFKALPSGMRDPLGVFNSNTLIEYSNAYFWTSTELDNTFNWYRLILYFTEDISRDKNDNRYGYSVRCVKDQ